VVWQVRFFNDLNCNTIERRVNDFLELYKNNILEVSNFELKRFSNDNYVGVLLFKWRVYANNI
jgi:hypothetical protein